MKMILQLLGRSKISLTCVRHHKDTHRRIGKCGRDPLSVLVCDTLAEPIELGVSSTHSGMTCSRGSEVHDERSPRNPTGTTCSNFRNLKPTWAMRRLKPGVNYIYKTCDKTGSTLACPLRLRDGRAGRHRDGSDHFLRRVGIPKMIFIYL